MIPALVVQVRNLKNVVMGPNKACNCKGSCLSHKLMRNEYCMMGLDKPVKQKPPLGLKPKSIHDLERTREILDAILRYLDAGKTPPKAWAKELELYFREEGPDGI